MKKKIVGVSVRNEKAFTFTVNEKCWTVRKEEMALSILGYNVTELFNILEIESKIIEIFVQGMDDNKESALNSIILEC